MEVSILVAHVRIILDARLGRRASCWQWSAEMGLDRITVDEGFLASWRIWGRRVDTWNEGGAWSEDGRWCLCWGRLWVGRADTERGKRTARDRCRTEGTGGQGTSDSGMLGRCSVVQELCRVISCSKNKLMN